MRPAFTPEAIVAAALAICGPSTDPVAPDPARAECDRSAGPISQLPFGCAATRTPTDCV